MFLRLPPSTQAAAPRCGTARAHAGSGYESGSRRAATPGSEYRPRAASAHAAAPASESGAAPHRAAPSCTDGAAARTAHPRGDLDDPSQVHHRDPGRNVPDDREIVGDEDVGQTEPMLQIHQQVDDLRLHRDVERGHRLVADDQLRLDRQARARCRCAGAGRRRTRADSAAHGRARPTVSQQLADARVDPRRVGRPCRRSGSARIAPTVICGFSDEYGSWKIICIARRRSRKARASSAPRSSPSNSTWPALGSIRRSSRRPSVDLPQPDSPTTPSVSPGPRRGRRRRRPDTAAVRGRTIRGGSRSAARVLRPRSKGSGSSAPAQRHAAAGIKPIRDRAAP